LTGVTDGGGDFIRGDIVTFLTAVTLDGTQTSPTTPRTLTLDHEFLLDSTGQTGVALGPVENVKSNAGDPGNTGAATVDSCRPAGDHGRRPDAGGLAQADRRPVTRAAGAWPL
jgi:hypothetical protein